MDDKQEIRILDACCGSRMFWWDKTEPHTTFMDIRQENRDITNGSVTKHVTVNPDVIADFRRMPFPDNHFDLVVFDPPHLIWAGPKSFMKAQYGQLPADWRSYMKDGFDECLRVLKNTGVLLFKWSQAQIHLADVLAVLGRTPILGDKHASTRWEVFLKQPNPLPLEDTGFLQGTLLEETSTQV